MPASLFQIGAWSAALVTLAQVVTIDLMLAGDNALAIGMAASGLDRQRRRRAVWLGLGAAVAMRIGLALIATLLLGVVGLLLAGGALLLWVCWRLACELRSKALGARKAAGPARPSGWPQLGLAAPLGGEMADGRHHRRPRERYSHKG